MYILKAIMLSTTIAANMPSLAMNAHARGLFEILWRCGEEARCGRARAAHSILSQSQLEKKSGFSL